MTSLSAWPAFLTPPAFPTEEQTQRARVFHIVAWNTVLVATFFLVCVALVQPHIAQRAMIALVVVDTLCVALLAVARRGRTRLASGLLVGGLVSIISALALQAGGIRSPGVGAYFIFILMAGLLLGERAAILTTFACGTTALGLVLAEISGVLPPQTVFYNPFSLWMLNCLYMGVIILLSRLTAQVIGGALGRAEAELSERTRAEQRLALALEAGAIGVWDFDLKMQSFHGDDRAFALFGLPLTPDRSVSTEIW